MVSENWGEEEWDDWNENAGTARHRDGDTSEHDHLDGDVVDL